MTLTGTAHAWSRALLIASLGALMCACASLQGQPDPVVPAKDIVADVVSTYPRPEVLKNFASTNANQRGGLTARAYRDAVAYAYLQASDARYRLFKASLSEEMKGSSVGFDTLVLLLNGVAAVSGKDTANALAAASATFVGTNSALKKEVFLERTIGVLITTMDAARTRKWTEIRQQLLSRDESQFPLGEALAQIDGLDDLASLNAAVSGIEAKAGAEKVEAEAEARALFSAPLAPPDVHSARLTFRGYVVGLHAQKDRATLDRLADVLQTPKDADLMIQRNNIILAYVQQATSPAAVAALSSALNPVTGRTFP